MIVVVVLPRLCEYRQIKNGRNVTHSTFDDGSFSFLPPDGMKVEVKENMNKPGSDPGIWRESLGLF